MVVFPWIAAHINHAVDRTRPPGHLAAGPIHLLVVDLLLRLGKERPHVLGVLQQPTNAQRGSHPKVIVVGSARLEQQHAGVWLLCQPMG